MTPEPLPSPLQDPSEKVVARITPAASPRIETERYVIHKFPRISATKLGEYLVSNASLQTAIAKNQKKAPKSIILRHRETRLAFSKSLEGSGFNQNYLKEKATQLRTAPFSTDWQQQNNAHSADALEKLASIAPGLEIGTVKKLHRPGAGWGGLEINGVTISIEPTIVFSFEHKKTTKVGAIILYCTKDDSKSLSKSLGDNCAGDYVGVLLLKLLEEKLSTVGVPLVSKCIVVDVFRSHFHYAPKSYKMLLRHVNDACAMIRSCWNDLEV
jgi:hypothetical protein